MLKLYNLKYIGNNNINQDMDNRFVITETNYIEYCRYILNKVKIIEAEMYIDKPDKYIMKYKKLNHGISVITSYMQHLFGIEHRIFNSEVLFDRIYGDSEYFLKFCRNHLQCNLLDAIRESIIDGCYVMANTSMGYKTMKIEEFERDYEFENSVNFDINISKWEGGKHYYAKVCGIDVVDGNGGVKWNTYSEAWRCTEWFMKNNNLIDYRGKKDER